MLDPFSFSLEIFVRQKQDRYAQEAARERLIREVKERPPREDGRRTEGVQEAFSGILYRILASGAKLMVTQMSYQRDANTSMHSHPSEQAGYVLSGRLRLKVSGQERIVGVGDVYLVPATAPHSLEALEAAEVLDIFSPPREDCLQPVRSSDRLSK